ncbi:TetR family transcriptional regulator [Rhodococcus hoagii]|uniref:TetR family transcriptional regulator n=2 Tax=Rhodococcus hoagii TaxID=43767 RepID=A0AAE3B917_RHOHA|nr:TetR/AcrR family transcriptional regulator [Prescottella equi]MBM4467962.1 TetR family transcriptional regulator [Prescottella equi]MBM4476140.1 TetR family transcriptional regulator [Prescottella equi]MBM4482507.1 TetR family transcriptional regulator [Prescottella equi]MBM4521975.1 TetR family transcriptional regulator [Prescottella equi]MBM4528230.1 TetR family transcriptional regulator [Prescottella equi]
MSHRPSRRESICEAALDLAAEGGNHAVTHQAIDRRLSLAKGSTSYYFRTRDALVGAAVRRLTERSRAAFAEAYGAGVGGVSVEGAADLMADQIVLLMTGRRRDVLARYALAVDAADDEELRPALAGCLFSVEKATGLLEALGASDPDSAAHDLISLLEGLVFDSVYGSRSVLAGGSTPSTQRFRVTIRLWLAALAES